MQWQWTGNRMLSAMVFTYAPVLHQWPSAEQAKKGKTESGARTESEGFPIVNVLKKLSVCEYSSEKVHKKKNHCSQHRNVGIHQPMGRDLTRPTPRAKHVRRFVFGSAGKKTAADLQSSKRCFVPETQ
jgi:hypothetical protein